ncbi:tRNA (adenosine(37)-N6)-threonylcarbamoyltransferase complex dimerization subunit type 1 TsaB [Marinospirillum alkaliphilum]|uniref:tRNA threonylcarbamoyladenosine biosynthesis protein TsaB n=1 Tax=Marinospirillum alkaliphilum DSM 21637 TaxID=1122209 RepID=A0A1K1VFG8_9GAMM|nr:tRNA (adenosine(37)-N6)-threonylcarbamoyltransferase complex dimerization subunit type 1 TsaB [Marinospirillum alkaliphilum]SFX23467.1 tRNA threonylcarbamoyladenosine biosynthesis protein TsaB [Marinospirillum alkaliphilum DSM 21637]
MTCILALDTSTDAGSVALWLDGEVVEDFQLLPRQQAQALLPQIEQLLSRAGISLQQLDALAFGRGPGSFTGLRIAAASVQGLALALDRPVIPVSTLQSLAWTAHQQYFANKVLTLLDARMDEVYWCAWQWQEDRPEALLEETLSPPEMVLLNNQQELDWVVAGSGAVFVERLPPVIKGCIQQELPDIRPSAGAMVQLAHQAWLRGELQDASAALPVYLRDKVTHGS